MNEVKERLSEFRIDIYNAENKCIGHYTVQHTCVLKLISDFDVNHDVPYKRVKSDCDGNIHLITNGATFVLEALSETNESLIGANGFKDEVGKIYWFKVEPLPNQSSD